MIHLHDRRSTAMKNHIFLRISASWEIPHGITLSEKAHKTIYVSSPKIVVVKGDTPKMLAVLEL